MIVCFCINPEKVFGSQLGLTLASLCPIMHGGSNPECTGINASFFTGGLMSGIIDVRKD